MTALDTYLDTHAERHLSELFEFLRHPSISTDPAHREDVRRCAQYLTDALRRLGFDTELVDTTGHPIVFAERLRVPGAPTVLFYGHYDVQPVDPLSLWHSPPFEPTLVDGAIVARGASDDKGQVFAHLKGLEAVLDQQGELPVNVKLLLEGEEECGSPSLEAFLEAYHDRLDADVVLVSDTCMFDRGQPAIVYALRGLAYLQINVRGPSRDLHSGAYGGAVDNPINALCHIVSGLKDREGRVLIPGFYDDVRVLRPEERAEIARLPFDAAAFLAEVDARGFGEPGYTTRERLGARPTLDVNGLWGGFTGTGAKTVLPSTAHAKISMRLVPHQRPDDINEKAVAFIHELAPPTVDVDVEVIYGSRPSLTERDSPWIKAATRALGHVYDRPPLFVREGGSIPIVGAFKDRLGLDTLLVGFGLNDDRIHSPNEKFDLQCFREAIRFSVHFWNEVAQVAR
jgi:acetylornithine deacetylase/succinyl-diaminopimelate desuccinylase-like protein